MKVRFWGVGQPLTGYMGPRHCEVGEDSRRASVIAGSIAERPRLVDAAVKAPRSDIRETLPFP